MTDMDFESLSEQPLSRREFAGRMAGFAMVATTLVVVSLGIGVLGYKVLEGMSWIDAFLNAAMILSGMGPVTELQSAGGKLFAGVYALFSGMVFLVVAGLLLAPVLHRILHLIHFDDTDLD